MSSGVLSPLDIRSVRAPNRFMVAPMCQYSVEGRDGLPTEWHHVHLATRAVGGAGIVMTEATAVEPRGRITPHDIGIWSDEHADALARTASFIADQGSVPAIQLAHAGRKASKSRPWEGSEPLQPEEGGWPVISASGLPYHYGDGSAPPTESMDQDAIESVIESFSQAASRAVSAGFEIVEIHAAHGYLLHQFLSPVTNDRDDAYGGDFEGRTRLLREVTEAVRDAVGSDLPIFVRISATDWLPDRESWTIEQSVRLADQIARNGADLIDVSTGGIHPDQEIPYSGPNFQVEFAERVRKETEADVLVGAVGRITTAEQAEALIRNDRADLAILGRKFLRDPYFPLHAAGALGDRESLKPPVQYERGF